VCARVEACLLAYPQRVWPSLLNIIAHHRQSGVCCECATLSSPNPAPAFCFCTCPNHSPLLPPIAHPHLVNPPQIESPGDMKIPPGSAQPGQGHASFRRQRASRACEVRPTKLHNEASAPRFCTANANHGISNPQTCHARKVRCDAASLGGTWAHFFICTCRPRRLQVQPSNNPMQCHARIAQRSGSNAEYRRRSARRRSRGRRRVMGKPSVAATMRSETDSRAATVMANTRTPCRREPLPHRLSRRPWQTAPPCCSP
jgi:hypothetical protein